MFPFMYRYLFFFLELILLFLKTCLVFLYLLPTSPKRSSRFLKCLPVCFKCLKHMGNLVFMCLAITPAPTPHPAAVKVSYVGVPLSQILCLLSSFTISFVEAHTPVTCYQEKVRGNSIFWKVEYLKYLYSFFALEWSFERWIMCSLFWRHFGSIIGFKSFSVWLKVQCWLSVG